jgi:hypothetical protein
MEALGEGSEHGVYREAEGGPGQTHLRGMHVSRFIHQVEQGYPNAAPAAVSVATFLPLQLLLLSD